MQHRIALLLIGLLIGVSTIAQQPCLQGYTYRRTVSITNNSTSSQSDQLIEIKFNASDLISNSKMLSSCADIAFSEDDGTTLDYWIDEENDKRTSQSVWVKIPNVPANGKDIYMFYGNPSAFSRSTQTIFDSFEDFNTLDNWSVCNVGGAYDLSSGQVEVKANTVLTANSPTTHNYEIIAYVSSISGTLGANITLGQYNSSSAQNGFGLTYLSDDPSDGAYQLSAVNNTCANLGSSLGSGNTGSGVGVWSFSWNTSTDIISGSAPANSMSIGATLTSTPASSYPFIAVSGAGSVTLDWLICHAVSEYEITASISTTEEAIDATTELSITDNAPFCAGEDDLILSASYISGASYLWKQDNTEISGETSHILNINNADVSNSGTYSVNVSLGSPECNSKTALVEVEIDEPIVTGDISEDVEVCESSNSGAIRLSNYAGNISGWQYRVNHAGLWYDLSASIDSMEYSSLSETHSFRALFESGTCGSGYSDSSTVTVSPSTNTGSITEDVTICEGTTGNVSLTTYTGDITDWEVSTDGISFTSLNHQNSSYQYTLVDTTYYRVQVKSGVCASKYSDTVRIAVSPSTNAGAVENGKYVCAESNGDSLFLVGAVGEVLRWEFSHISTGQWSENSSSEEFFIYQDLDATTYYRALVESPGCSQLYSKIDTVVVEQKPDAGELTGSAEVCATSNLGYLELNSYSDKIINWLISTDKNSWLPYDESYDTINYTNLQQDKYYRAIVNTSNEVCTPDTSEIASILVSPATVSGSLYSGQTVLCEQENKDTIVVTGEQGDVSFWESSSNGETPWSVIAISNDSLPFENLESTRWYRAVVISGSCDQIKTDPIQITIDASSDGGLIIGSSEACELVNEGEINLLNYTGEIAFWQYSIDESNWATYPGGNAETVEYSGLIDTSYFRAIVKSGLCPYDTSTTAKITVNPLPDVAYTVGDVNFGDAAVFANTTTITGGSIQSWFWDFGDNESSASKNPSHSYTSEGNYHVSLTAYSNKGCVDSASSEVSVFGLPDVDFSFENVCLFSEMSFTNTSVLNSSSTYLWNFGDGSAITSGTDAEHTYTEAGDYTVSLRAVSAFGGVDSVTKLVSVYERAVPDFTTENICEGETAEFSNRSTPVSLSMTYKWDFGNGETDLRTDPEVEYTESGAYLVELEATTLNGCVNTIERIVRVYSQPEADFVVDDVPYRQASMFFNQSSIVPYSELSYQWDFGDGATSDLSDPTYYYDAPGVYQVVLTATSDSGCINQLEKSLKVFDLPMAKFSLSDVCYGDSVEFVNESTVSSGTINYDWDFGDENTSTEENPKHIYLQAGSYMVQLICVTSNGARDTTSQAVNVYELPNPDFEFNEACDGYTTFFTNTSVVYADEIESTVWDFDDGSNSIQTSPEYTFLNAGVYSVKLEVITSNECQGSVVKDVILHPNPVADFTAQDVCVGAYTQFINYTELDNTIRPYTLVYEWEFGESGSSVQEDPSYNYQNSGLYKVQLVASTDANCYDTLTRYTEVFSLPEADAGDDTTASKGFEIQLNATGGDFYEWSPETGLSDISIPDPEARPMETTEYVVRVIDENSCSTSDTLMVFVEDELRIVPSNILTPNNNGENDTWNIVNIDSYPEAEILLFDRWGKMIYKVTGYVNDWTGVNQNGDILPDGTYYYVIQLSKGSEAIYKGAITILRDKE